MILKFFLYVTTLLRSDYPKKISHERIPWRSSLYWMFYNFVMFFSPMSPIFVERFRNFTLRVHYCRSPTITKPGYDQGIPWVSRRNANFYNLTAYAHLVLTINFLESLRKLDFIWKSATFKVDGSIVPKSWWEHHLYNNERLNIDVRICFLPTSPSIVKRIISDYGYIFITENNPFYLDLRLRKYHLKTLDDTDKEHTLIMWWPDIVKGFKWG